MAPLTAYNFYCLCTGEFPPIDGQELKLKGSYFYSSNPSVGLMGGDITVTYLDCYIVKDFTKLP